MRTGAKATLFERAHQRSSHRAPPEEPYLALELPIGRKPEYGGPPCRSRNESRHLFRFTPLQDLPRLGIGHRQLLARDDQIVAVEALAGRGPLRHDAARQK